MPPDETVVQVILEDGSEHRAFYSCNIMEAGDWEFVPVDENDEPTDEAFWPEVSAWKPVTISPDEVE